MGHKEPLVSIPGFDEKMAEQRKFERFTLRLHTTIETVGPEQEKETFDLVSKDVCAGGAFYPTDKIIRKGTKIKLRLTLSSETLKELTGTQGFLEIGGTVVRTGPNGMAICFDENYDFI